VVTITYKGGSPGQLRGAALYFRLFRRGCRERGRCDGAGRCWCCLRVRRQQVAPWF